MVTFVIGVAIGAVVSATIACIGLRAMFDGEMARMSAFARRLGGIVSSPDDREVVEYHLEEQ